MTWKQKAIKVYRDWLKNPDDNGRLIPPGMQVGKILEFCLCSEYEAVRFIDLQIEEDKKFSTHDNYWLDVKKAFYEAYTNNLILEE